MGLKTGSRRLTRVKMSKVFCWPRTGTYPAAACQQLETSARQMCTERVENGEAWESPCGLAWVCQRIIKSKTDFKIPVEGTTVQNITLPPPFSPAVQPSLQTIQRTKRRLRLASSCQHFANRKAKWGVSKDEEPAFEEPAFHHSKTLTNIDGTDWGKITYKACHHRNAKVGGCQTPAKPWWPGIHSYCWVV